MQKVIITKEQAKAIESARTEATDDCILRDTGRIGVTWINETSPLNFMDLALLAKALYIGYEIDNSYKKGDKVLFQVEDSIPVIATLQNKIFQSKDEWSTDEAIGHISEQYFRHATKEEVLWLGELNREKIGEFQETDVVRYGNHIYQVFYHMGCPTYNNHISPEYAKELYEKGELEWIIPAQSLKPFPKESES